MDINRLGYWEMEDVLIMENEAPEVEVPSKYNTDDPIKMWDGKVVLVIKTLDGDVEICG